MGTSTQRTHTLRSVLQILFIDSLSLLTVWVISLQESKHIWLLYDFMLCCKGSPRTTSPFCSSSSRAAVARGPYGNERLEVQAAADTSGDAEPCDYVGAGL